jgi:hypothetical protein
MDVNLAETTEALDDQGSGKAAAALRSDNLA